MKFKNLDDLLAASSTGFAVGDAVTMADFVIYYITDCLTEMFLQVATGPAAIKLLFGDKPSLAAHKAMMAARPNIVKLKAGPNYKNYGRFMTGKGPFGER